MKVKFGCALVIVLSSLVLSQVPGPDTHSGRFIAANYGQWQVTVQSTPTGKACVSPVTVVLADGSKLDPWNTNAPLLIGSGSNAETVTPTAFDFLSSPGQVCISATYTKTHFFGEPVSSGTFGLQEALNSGGVKGGGAVTIDQNWTALGGTNTVKNAASLPSNVLIEDARTGIAGSNAGLNTLGPSFNVAVNYGCKPDGSSGSPTDNSTCIANAFAASNAVTGGVPTVYFPCVPGTGCQYNINAGSGLSPLNPVIPTAIKCDPEVTLNFTSYSTAHALDIGPTTTTTITQAAGLANKGYSILYCRFTGGANITEGVFINQYTPKVEIRGNTFYDFGNASSYSVWCQAECWWLNVQTNYEWNDDGVAHNFLSTNNATGTLDDESYIANNLNVCITIAGAAVVNCGVGYSLDGFFTLYSNDLAGHVPLVRVKPHTNGCHIFENVMEVDVPAAGNKSAIESNNGGADTQCEVAGNNLYTGAATDALVGVTSGSDVVTLWNVHDNWIRSDSAAQGTVFHLNNLANQTSQIIARNNARFGGVINSGSNLGSILSDNFTGNVEISVLGGYTIGMASTASITGPVPVKQDTGNANQVVVTTTTDTGAGVVVGVCSNSPSAGQGCQVLTTGIQAMFLGTGSCAIGNFVIVDTTTNGRVKCTATYTAGTVIGVSMQAFSTIGGQFNVMVGLR